MGWKDLTLAGASYRHAKKRTSIRSATTNLARVPQIAPRSAPVPDLMEAFRDLRAKVSSQRKAPRNGPMSSPMGKKKMPPIAMPSALHQIAAAPHPYRFAPTIERSVSVKEPSRASKPSVPHSHHAG